MIFRTGGRLIGRIINYRRSRHSQYEKQYVVSVEGISSRADAAKLVGKTVVWKSPGKRKIIGKVSAAHGSKGGVRAGMERGLPGQAIGTGVEIAE